MWGRRSLRHGFTLQCSASLREVQKSSAVVREQVLPQQELEQLQQSHSQGAMKYEEERGVVEQNTRDPRPKSGGVTRECDR